MGIRDPAAYEAWYATPRGRWIAASETALLARLLGSPGGGALLDLGTGTGHFARRLAPAWPMVVGADPDLRALAYAAARGGGPRYVAADGARLPFAAGAFEAAVAVTSLCFVADPVAVLREAWRVTRRVVVLGLLHRRSLLHLRKRGRGGYRGARWDTRADVRRWARALDPPPARVAFASAVLLPGGGALARAVERLAGGRLPWGGFLAAALWRPAPP